MNATAADYERLARTVMAGRDMEEDDWQELCINEHERCVSTTRETLDDFRAAAKGWREPGRCQEINGGLYWAQCQAAQGQPRCELCIVNCGEFRLIYQV